MRLRVGRSGSLLAAFVLAVASAAVAVDETDWELLLQERYLGPFPVPEEALIFDIDSARFRLRSGSLWLQTPLSSGAVVGLVFEGDGNLWLDIPDSVELAQFRRYVEDEEIERIDTDFDRLVIQTATVDVVELLTQLLATAQGSEGPERRPPDKIGWASQRQQRWRQLYGRDPAGRTIAALRNFDGRYFHADFETEEHGWLSLEYDDLRSEELVLESFETRGSYVTLFNKIPYPILETWLSLDRQRDREPDGRSAKAPNHASKLIHLDAEIDLVRPGRAPRQGIGQSHSVRSRMKLEARYRSLRDGLGSLRLQLDPLSVVESVSRIDGAPLQFLRYPTGEHAASKDDRLHNPQLVVLLDEPLFAGDELALVFETELELIDHAGGLHWYPTPVETDFEAHTADLEFRHRPDTGVVALGQRLDGERYADGKSKTRFRVDQPSSMIGFSFAQKPHSVDITSAGGLPITLFGTTHGVMSKKRVGKLGDQVSLTLEYLTRLFGFPISTERLVISLTENDAQAFPGLIQLWNGFVIDGVVGQNDHGYAEHFIAHELAHLWWGHQVGWASYRDYWLVEALAEYTAFLYVESELERGEQVAERILAAYTDSVTGSLRSRFDSFASWGLAFGSMSGAGRAAPISHGGRARISETPAGAYGNIYRKGMLVLHMIRMQSRAQTGDDDAFFEILRGYAERFRGKKPTTDDFRRVVAAHIPGDWQRFFAQWIDGAEIPTMRWRHEGQSIDGAFRLALDVRRDDVPPGFVVEVPLLFEHVDGTQERRLVSVQASPERIEIEMDRRPLRMSFNEEHGLLASMRRRDRGWHKIAAP